MKDKQFEVTITLTGQSALDAAAAGEEDMIYFLCEKFGMDAEEIEVSIVEVKQ